MTEDEFKDGRGDAIKRRMESIGMSVKDLAEAAGLSRGQVYRVFRDEENVREQSYTACERALDRIEDEHSGPDAVMSTDRGLIEFEITGDFGVRVVVRAPMENAAETEAMAAKLIRDMRRSASED